MDFWTPPRFLMQSRLKTSFSREKFNLDLQNSPQKIGPCWLARLKFSRSRLKCSIPEGDLVIFFNFWGPRSQSPDLPPPHGLATSETMVSDHGLGPPLSTKNPEIKGFSGSGPPIFGFGLADPTTKG